MRMKAALAILLAFVLLLSVCVGGFAQEALSEEELREQEGMLEEEGKGSRIVVYEDRVMFVYPDYSEYLDILVDEVNRMAEALPERLNKYLMIPPKRSSLEVEELRELSADELQAAQYVFRHIDPSIVFVDAYYTLDQYARNLNDIYFRLDHHWTPLGAFYVSEAFFVSADIPYHTLDEYKKIEAGEWNGWLSLLARDKTLYEKPDQRYYYQLPGTENRTVEIYRPATKTREASVEEVLLVDPSRYGYSIFLGEYGFYQAMIRGDETKDRSLLVVGFSSSYSLIPFMADNFKNVVLIEPRRYTGGKQDVEELIVEYGITDVLMIVSYTARSLKLI